MAIRVKVFILTAFIFACVSCARLSMLDPDEYLEFLKNSSDVIRERSIKELDFKCRYRTADEMVLLESKENSLTKAEFDSLYSKYNSLMYFTFLIGTSDNNEIINVKGENNYSQMLDYISNEMQNDFMLLHNNDTIPCRLYYYERNYGLSGTNAINLGFDMPSIGKPESDFTVLYEDKILNTGPLKFKFDIQKINHLPLLRYEKK